MEYCIVNFKAFKKIANKTKPRSTSLFFDILTSLGGEWRDMKAFSKEDIAIDTGMSARDVSSKFRDLVKFDMLRLTAEGYIVNPNIAQWSKNMSNKPIKEWNEMTLITKKVWKF